MKTSLRYQFALFATAAALPSGAVLAQSPAPSTTPSVSVPADTTNPTGPAAHGRQGGGQMRERLAALTPEEKEKLMAARKKAKEDPAVKAAEATRETDRKGFHKAMHDAMLRADPSVGPILEKLRAAEGRGSKKVE